MNSAFLAWNQTNDHVETGGFACTIWTQQANNLTTLYSDTHIMHDRAGSKTFGQMMGGEDAQVYFILAEKLIGVRVSK